MIDNFKSGQLLLRREICFGDGRTGAKPLTE
jgi:hypothetical protein